MSSLILELAILFLKFQNIDFLIILICFNAASLNEYNNHRCKRENVESDALKEWKISIFKIIDIHISFYSRNANTLPPKP